MPVKFFGQAFSINPFQCFCYHPFYAFGKQAVEKPLVNIKNGVAGAKPPTGSRGGSPSNIAPFLGKGAWGFGKDAEIERPKALQGRKAHKAFL